ncbi:MAG: sugar phosphate isomerase/epimerase family protein [Halanaerobiaceae bacterium]
MSNIGLGVKIILNTVRKEKIEEKFNKVKKMGFSSCQLDCWNEDLFTESAAEFINHAQEEFGVKVTAFWCGWPGPAHWNFYEGPVTLGLVPEVYQFSRMKMLRKGSDFAQSINVDKLVTHVGFIPENPNNSKYKKVIEAVRYVAGYCENNEQYFLFETGQETPVTLLRAIQDIGLDNLGINLDPANLLMYGKANPVDALDVFGEYVMGVHAKDGEYPTDGRKLGVEKPLGEGRVDFPSLIAGLEALDYEGTLTIEREISGDRQIKDIKAGKKYLEKYI